MTRLFYFENYELTEICEVDRESAPNFTRFNTFGKIYCDTHNLKRYDQCMCVNDVVVCVFTAYFCNDMCVYRHYRVCYNGMSEDDFISYMKYAKYMEY